MYTRDTPGDLASGWTQVAKLTADDGAVSDYFGYSVSIDGDTMVIAAHSDDDDVKGDNSGSAYVFTRTTAGNLASGWTQVAKLTAGDGAADDYFGTSVSIDGDTMVIGARMRGRRQGIKQRVRVRVHARHGRRPRLQLDAGRQTDRGRRRCG